MPLTIHAKSSDLATLKTDCLVLFVNPEKNNRAIDAVNKAANLDIKKLIKQGDLGKDAGSTLLLHQPDAISARRLLLVNSGSASIGDRAYIKLCQQLALQCQSLPKQIAIDLQNLSVEQRSRQWQARMLAETLVRKSYRFDQYKSEKTTSQGQSSKTFAFITASKKQLADTKQGIALGLAIGNGAALARDLGNTPPNICHPVYLARQAKALARGQNKLSVKVLDEKAMEALGMHSFLSVGQGSAQPSQFIVMEYKGGKKGEAPHAIVGKGITFDSGGISIKPSAAMDEMKYDMCGAAAVLGIVHTVLALQLKTNIIFAIAAAENMPSANASRPGDIVTSLSGKTIEILNTDAEGRLVLCDALTYVQRYKPKSIIDMATLTGTVISALGRQASGLLSNDEQLAQTLIEAGQHAGERVWQLPLWEEYTEQLNSPFADISNLGGPEAGTITAACFLAEFVKGQRWAHLDIAGTAWVQGDNKGATGTPVGLITEYLLRA